MKKIVVSLMLAVLLLSTCLFSVSAAGNGSLSATSASGYRGDTVTVNVNLGSNPGLITMKFQISYSANLTLVSVSNSGLLGGWTTPAPTIQSPYTLRWADSLATVNNTANGKLVTLTFKINDDAKIGTETVSITFNESRDATGGRNTFNSTSAGITIKCRHDYGNWTKLDNNQHGQTCSICNDVQKENHGWNSGTETKTPSCKEEGEKTYSCSVCNGTKVEPIEKTDNHNYGAWSKADETSHSKSCSICNNVVTEAHDWDSVVTKKANCKETGIMTHSCKTPGCGASYTEDIPVDDDAHVFGNLTAVDDVNHKDVCSICEDEITQPHDYDNGVVTKKPNCKEEGEKTYTCGECNHKKVEKMDKTTDHSYGKWTEVDGTNHKHICSVCEKEETAAHTWNSGAVTKKPNCKETGIRTFTCTGCSATYTEDIDKTEDHKYGAWTKVDADNHKHICSVCEKEETVAHTYKTSWSKDKTGHWHECSGCRDKIDFVEHTPGAAPTEWTAQTCTVCRYVIKPALGHTHKWNKNLTTDAEGHWYACSGCEEKKDAAAHDFENGCDPDCATCGYTREVAHDISEAWTSDGTNHWHECSICGLKEDTAAHEPGAEATEFTAQTCTICGKELVAALGHSFSEEWNSDEESHWRDCACGEKGDLAKHTYEDGICSVCGAEEPKSFVIWIVVGVVAVAAIAAGAVLVIKKKK